MALTGGRTMTDNLEKIVCAGLIGFIIGAIISWFTMAMNDVYFFKISIQQTKQNIISFPNGTVFKKITQASEVLND